MKRQKRNTCTHPKRRIAKFFDETTNTYVERCIRCGKVLYKRKFVGDK